MTVTDAYGRTISRESARACVGAGWQKLVDECYDICDKHNIAVMQIKEKFGGLRFYVGSAPKEVFDVIDRAEEMSEVTCEECGEPGIIFGRGWLRCLCDSCRGAK